ncbi:hypothetical protein Avbf_01462 [Armadillidium vulgare]|nr:hypothetical protein Avbf_01462 [Armadillidium vulgare]
MYQGAGGGAGGMPGSCGMESGFSGASSRGPTVEENKPLVIDTLFKNQSLKILAIYFENVFDIFRVKFFVISSKIIDIINENKTSFEIERKIIRLIMAKVDMVCIDMLEGEAKSKLLRIKLPEILGNTANENCVNCHVIFILNFTFL